MHVNLASGLLEGVDYRPSPNFDERPAGIPVDTLVIHAISMPPGEYPGPDIERLFCNSLDFACHPFYQEIDGLTVTGWAIFPFLKSAPWPSPVTAIIIMLFRSWW